MDRMNVRVIRFAAKWTRDAANGLLLRHVNGLAVDLVRQAAFFNEGVECFVPRNARPRSDVPRLPRPRPNRRAAPHRARPEGREDKTSKASPKKAEWSL